MATCPECGAVSAAPCGELFHRLLALDHSRREPWGSLHGIAVACYRLQHPASLDSRAFPLELLRTYVADGTEAAHRLTAHARRANSHLVRSRGRATTDGRVDTPDGFTVTIAEVAVDGGFPADGHPKRVRKWAEATLAAWQG
ncbi:MAG: DUF5946 family protein [Nocardiopsaceae bacterium]|nr:DUF5946 family protein [Nocardiopsaceae bacterium]